MRPGPNFNLNAGRTLARFVLANGVTVDQLEGATAAQAIHQLHIAGDARQAAVRAGWNEIKAEALRVVRVNRPTDEERSVSEIRAILLDRWPDLDYEKIADKVYTLYLEGRP